MKKMEKEKKPLGVPDRNNFETCIPIYFGEDADRSVLRVHPGRNEQPECQRLAVSSRPVFQIRMFLGLSDPLVIDMAPDPSIIKQNSKKSLVSCFFLNFL